ncbi:replication protein [Desulforegula conservatrix]|uniref:replication protein n=1 Tax=Desulforegula conservatrix TaxID=153026 RepID=UPI0018DD3182|nr:replication protein [Desulforegula conservatrix]
MPDRGNRSFIDNEFFEAVAKHRIPGEQMQVLSAIVRKTWCWSKDSDRIAVSQIVEITGLKKQNVFRSIQALITKNIISVIKNDDKAAHIIEINRDFGSWVASSKKITSSKVIQGVIKNDDKTSSKVMDTKDNKDTLTKDIKNSYCSDFENPNDTPPPDPELKPEKKTKIYSFSEKHLLLADLLHDEILKNKPDFKFPGNYRNEWSDTARLMTDRDKREPEDIKAIILWSQSDEFWKSNILSMSKLRIQFDKLQMQQKKQPMNGKKSSCPMTNYVTPKDLAAEAAKYANTLPDPEDWLK